MLFAAGNAFAQDVRGLLDNLFSRGEPRSSQASDAGRAAVTVRARRAASTSWKTSSAQLTGQIEQLQFRNQQLEQELARVGGRRAGCWRRQPLRAGAGRRQRR